MSITIENTTRIFARNGKEVSFDLTPLMAEYFLAYGIRQSCSDAFAPAATKGETACWDTLNARLSKMAGGELPSASGERIAPMESILRRLVVSLVIGKKKAKRADAEKGVKAGAERYFRACFTKGAVDATWERLTAEAKAELTARANAPVDVDLD